MKGDPTFWILARASGLTAYGLVTASIVVGLVLKARPVGTALKPATVTDLLESPVMQAAFPGLYKHLKLVSSTPIRNMATLAGNFVNASPIGACQWPSFTKSSKLPSNRRFKSRTRSAGRSPSRSPV